MRHNRALAALAAALLAAGCSDLDVTDPTRRTDETFYRDAADATYAINGVYNAMQENGVYGRNLHVASDGRTDLATSRSPDGSLLNFTRTIIPDYQNGYNATMWTDPYRAIFRANQVLLNVPNVEMDAALKTRILGEARFIRAAMYGNLTLLFGGVPIVPDTATTSTRPETRPAAEVLAYIEQEATAAAAALPTTYTGNDRGRVTKGAALMLLAQAQLQGRKWADAAATLQQIVALNVYQLTPTFAENFRIEGDNNVESVFEVGFGPDAITGQGTRGHQIARLVGPPEIGFTDIQPTSWYFDQFFAERGPALPDPRLDLTLFWNKPGGQDVYSRPFATRYPTGFKGETIDKTYFWKKWGEYYQTFQTFNSAINMKVFRYAAVLLELAEARNEAGQPAAALAPLNQVRARVGLPAITVATQAGLRPLIEREMLMELGWENYRLPYLKRHDMFNKATLLPHDPDFNVFNDATGQLMPVPQTERDLNPNVLQNPGY